MPCCTENPWNSSLPKPFFSSSPFSPFSASTTEYIKLHPRASRPTLSSAHFLTSSSTAIDSEIRPPMSSVTAPRTPSSSADRKLQHKTANYEFNTKSLRYFAIQNVTIEIQTRRILLLQRASESEFVLNLTNVLEWFAFGNVCKLAFNVDLACLAVEGYDDAMISSNSCAHSRMPLHSALGSL
ncbi:hypothetical protein PIB30_009168 [Stylosanthes scabra]|uniref:Uncharacterized protein n=1 Tax=Stylosanthes scabra TaxID=79078 RepID=A0ABU6Y339_9FABA|nr:hypothetical protein [Stylosanthes scabra]